MAVTLLLAKSTTPVGLSGAQLPPPDSTGMINHLPTLLGVSKKKSWAEPITVFTWPLFWQIIEPMPIFPSMAEPEQVEAVVNPALMSGAPEEQSKNVVQQAFSPVASF